MPDIDFFVPPRVNNVDGETRHVGVEIEYAGISAKDSAEIVRELLGGSVVADSPHRHRVEGTELGDFVCELDFQYAHPSMDPKKDSEALRELDSRLSEMIGDASASFVPVEIASPPLPFDMLPSLEPLIGALRRAGALGTNEGFSYAFGLHLNPEVADDSAEWITAVLRAYLILSDWLRAEIDIDLTRRLFRFADPFPKDYLRLVCGPDYHPDLDRLIDDYLLHNPTRNRELDMLPLFSWIDADRVAATIDDSRIGKRPTFHYRLPNAKTGDSRWSIADDWNRWVIVERLADDPERMELMAVEFLDRRSRWLGGDWAARVREWLTKE